MVIGHVHALAFLVLLEVTPASFGGIPSDTLLKHLLTGTPLEWSSASRIRPPVPSWPKTFTIDFYVYIEQYGPNWNSTGTLYYDWPSEVCQASYVRIKTINRRSMISL